MASRELDALIQETVAASKDTLCFSTSLKQLIYKHSEQDEQSVGSFMATLLSINSPQTRMLASTALLKVNKAAKIDNLLQLVRNEAH